MRKLLAISIVLLSLFVSCSSYTLAEGRANISLPEYDNLPNTKLDENSTAKGVAANAIFVDLGADEITEDNKEIAIQTLKAVDSDFIVLYGSMENQVAIRKNFENVYELSGVTIILSDRPSNTQMLELYVGEFPAILAETRFPVLDSAY